MYRSTAHSQCPKIRPGFSSPSASWTFYGSVPQNCRCISFTVSTPGSCEICIKSARVGVLVYRHEDPCTYHPSAVQRTLPRFSASAPKKLGPGFRKRHGIPSVHLPGRTPSLSNSPTIVPNFWIGHPCFAPNGQFLHTMPLR